MFAWKHYIGVPYSSYCKQHLDHLLANVHNTRMYKGSTEQCSKKNQGSSKTLLCLFGYFTPPEASFVASNSFPESL
jgi:hypothetical protein